MITLILSHAIDIFAKIAEIVFRANRDNKIAFIIPPDDKGSLGDQAMVLALLEHLVGKGYTPIFFTFSNDPSRYWGKSIGGKIRPIAFLRLLRYASTSAVTIVVGADVMDGKYSPLYSFIRIRIAALANRAGRIGIISPCSFNESPAPLVTYWIRRLGPSAPIFARDESSYRALKKHTNSIQLSADLAFSYHATKVNQFNQQSPYIGINVNPLIPKLNSHFSKAYFAVPFANWLTRTFPNGRFLGIAHDTRPQSNDNAGISTLMSAMPGNIEFIPPQTPHSIEDVVRQVSNTSLVICGRMHLAICAISHSKPVIAFTYQDKFSGLREIVGSNWIYLIEKPEDLENTNIQLWIANALTQNQAFSATIAQERLSVFFDRIPSSAC